MSKPRIVQHIFGFANIGGPSSQLHRLLDSRLKDKYDFTVVNQNRPAKGINIPLIWEMSQAMKKARPDLIHVRGLQNEGFHGVMAAYLAGCPRILVSAHGFSENGSVRNLVSRWLLSHILEPLTLMLAHRVFCVCKEATNHSVIRRFAKNKCSIIYNGINTTPLKEQDDGIRKQLGVDSKDVVALFVGRISRDKGLFFLGNAIGEMSNPPVIWLAGDGPDIVAFRNTYSSLIKAGRIMLLGRRDDVSALLNECDFFVFPSLHENLSNALLEAMQAERAVLATAVGGNPELVLNGITGILVPPGDSLALAHNLAFLTDQRKLRQEMGIKGRERVQRHFSLDHMTEKLESLYDSMLEN